MKYWVALLAGLTLAVIYLMAHLWIYVPAAAWDYLGFVELPGYAVRVLVVGFQLHIPVGGRGTVQEQILDFFLEVPTNALFYSGLLWGLPRVVRRLRKQQTSSS